MSQVKELSKRPGDYFVDMAHEPGVAMSAALTQEQFDRIDAYWRAANYLSVGQIYLFDNPLLKEPLAAAHVKPRLLGHWGTTPGQNFVYVHLNRAIKQYDLNMIYISGPGAWRAGIGGQHVPGRHVQRSVSACQPGRSRPETVVQAVLLSRRHSQPRRAGNARLDPRGGRIGLQPGACRLEPFSIIPICWWPA